MLLDHRHAAAHVLDLVGERGRRLRRVEAAAGLLRQPLQQRGAQCRVVELGVARGHLQVRDVLAQQLVTGQRLDPDLVEPFGRRGERGAVLAVPLRRPLHRQIRELAVGMGHRRHHDAVVELFEVRVAHRGQDGRRLARLHAVLRELGDHLVRHPVDQPAEQPAPVGLVGHVVDRDVGVHLPRPRVLHRERHRLAGAVPLERQHDQIAVRRRQQRRRARLHLRDRIDDGDRRQLPPACGRQLLGVGDLRRGVRGPGAGGLHRHLDEEGVLPIPALLADHDGQHVGDRCAGVAALGERPPAAEHQQASAAVVDEVGDHAELIGREVVRLDAAEDETAVLEQLGAGARKAAGQIVRAVDIEPHELVLGGPLQDGDLQVLVVLDRPAQELDLETRLALEVENLVAPIVDRDQRLADVVLRHHLALLRRDPEGEEPRSGLARGEAQAHGLELTVAEQRNVLGPDDPPLVLHLDRHRPAGVAPVGDHDVRDERAAAQHAARRLHPAELDVALVRLAAQTDREDRYPGRLNRQQRLFELPAGVVGPVGHDHEPGQRHVGQLVVGAGERLPEMGAGPVELELVDHVEPVRLGREAEEAQREAFVQRGAQIALQRGELVLHELQPRRLVPVGDPHAAGIVDQHAEEVLLRNHRRQHQDGPHQTEGEQRERRQSHGGEHDPIERPAVAADLGVGTPRHDAGRHRRRQREPAGPRGTEREVPLLEDQRSVLEEQLEQRFHVQRRRSNVLAGTQTPGTPDAFRAPRPVYARGISGSSRRR